jgi:hypothetical protein
MLMGAHQNFQFADAHAHEILLGFVVPIPSGSWPGSSACRATLIGDLTSDVAGRGHWFDPSTAHHLKSSTYALSQGSLELRVAAGMASAEISRVQIPMDAPGSIGVGYGWMC